MSPRRAPALAADLRDAVALEGDLLRQLRAVRSEIGQLLLRARQSGLPYRALARGLIDATGNPAVTELALRRAARALRERHRRARLEDTQRGAIPLPAPGSAPEDATTFHQEDPMMKTTPVISEVQLPVRRTTTTVVEEFVEVEDIAGADEPDDEDDEDQRPAKRRGSR